MLKLSIFFIGVAAGVIATKGLSHVVAQSEIRGEQRGVENTRAQLAIFLMDRENGNAGNRFVDVNAWRGAQS